MIMMTREPDSKLTSLPSDSYLHLLHVHTRWQIAYTAVKSNKHQKQTAAASKAHTGLPAHTQQWLYCTHSLKMMATL